MLLSGPVWKQKLLVFSVKSKGCDSFLLVLTEMAVRWRSKEDPAPAVARGQGQALVTGGFQQIEDGFQSTFSESSITCKKKPGPSGGPLFGGIYL